MVVFTFTEINYLMVSLFRNLCTSFPICICGIKFLTALFALFPAERQKFIHNILVEAHQAKLFSNKMFS